MRDGHIAIDPLAGHYHDVRAHRDDLSALARVLAPTHAARTSVADGDTVLPLTDDEK